MKALINKMKDFTKAVKKNNKGLSLVELICAIAIMSVIMAGIVGSVVVSTNYYAKGANDVALQQSAQVLTNFLTNLIVDADSVTTVDENTLQIVDIHNATSTVVYDKTRKTLSLTSDKGDGILSDNLSAFSFVNNFSTNKSVSFKFTLLHDNRHFKSSFTSTSRNGTTKVSDGAVILLDKPVILMEPGQADVVINYSVITSGTVTDRSLEGVSVDKKPISHANPLFDGDPSNADFSSYSISGSTIVVHCGTREMEGSFDFTVATNAQYTDEFGISWPYDYKKVKVIVRRVDSISITSTANYTGGGVGEGFVVTAMINVDDVKNGEFKPAYETSAEYVSPYVASLTDIRIYDSLHPGDTSKDLNVGTYLSLSPQDIVDPESSMVIGQKSTVKIAKDIPYGYNIKITARAEHSFFTNKSSVPYYQFINSATSDVGVKSSIDIGVKAPFSMMESNFARGKECYLEDFIDTAFFPAYKSGNSGAIRFREKFPDGTYGDWSTFVRLEPAGANYKFPKDLTQFLFKPNAAYELEMVPVSFDGATVASPNYAPLLNAWGKTYSGDKSVETIYSCGTRIEIDACQVKNLHEGSSDIRNNNGEKSTIKFVADSVTSFEASVQDKLRLNAMVGDSTVETKGLGFNADIALKDSSGNSVVYDFVVGMEYTVYDNIPNSGFFEWKDLHVGDLEFYPFERAYDPAIPEAYYHFLYAK